MSKVADIAAAIVMVALVTTLVSHKNTVHVVNAFGSAFANSLRAAQGH